MRPLSGTNGVPIPTFTKLDNNLIRQKTRSCRTFVPITCSASDKNVPDGHLKRTQLPIESINLQSTPNLKLPPNQQPVALPKERALPSGLWEMELLLSKSDGTADISSGTIERWSEAYKQMTRDAQELGIPASVIPQLPANPTKDELRQARDHLERMMQSFLSAGL